MTVLQPSSRPVSFSPSSREEGFVREPTPLRVLSTYRGLKNPQYLFNGRREYTQTRDLAFELFHAHPPMDHVYLGIGRSPVPVMALLKELGGVQSANLPISGLGNKFELSPAQKVALFVRFERAIPSAIVRSGKDFVLVDAVYKGNSMVSLADLFPEYLASRGLSAKTIPYAMPMGGGGIDRYTGENLGGAAARQGWSFAHNHLAVDVLFRMAWADYENHAEYPKAPVTSEIVDYPHRPENAQLRRVVRAYMADDEDLRPMLAQLNRRMALPRDDGDTFG